MHFGLGLPNALVCDILYDVGSSVVRPCAPHRVVCFEPWWQFFFSFFFFGNEVKCFIGLSLSKNEEGKTTFWVSA